MAAPVNPVPPSSVPPAPEPPAGPGTAGLWIGSVLIVISVVGGFVWILVAAVGVIGQLTNGPFVPLGTTGQVELEARTYGVWVASLDNSKVPQSDLELTITSESGESVGVEPLPPSASGLQNQPTLRPLGDVDIPVAGSYRVSTSSSVGGRGDDVRVVFADPIDRFASDLGVRIGGGAVVALLVFVVGLVLTIVTAIRRRNARRLHQAMRWGYTPPGSVAPGPTGPGGPGVVPPVPPPVPPAPPDPWAPEPRDPWANR